MLKLFKNSWQIAKKDLIEFTRDRLRLATFFIMPIFMMVLTGFIFPNQNSLKGIPIGIANQDSSEISKNLTDAVSNLKMSDDNKSFIVSTYQDVESIKDGIKKQDISGGLFIPSDFSQKITKNEQTEITIVEDQSNPQVASVVNQVLAQVVGGFSKQLGIQKIDNLLVSKVNPGNNIKSTVPAEAFMNPVASKIEGIIPGDTNYFEFVAPGIMAMVVMTSVLTGLASAIARESEQGTLDGILISPINRMAIILGKATSQSIRGLVQGGVVLLLAFLLFGVTVQGSLLLVVLLLFLGIFSFVGIGILVSAISTEQETATQILAMFQFPMLFLSGTFFPILMMPEVMQKIAHFFPLTYAITALRKVIVLGAGIESIGPELIILMIFGAVTLSISVPVFKRIITR